LHDHKVFILVAGTFPLKTSCLDLTVVLPLKLEAYGHSLLGALRDYLGFRLMLWGAPRGMEGAAVPPIGA